MHCRCVPVPPTALAVDRRQALPNLAAGVTFALAGCGPAISPARREAARAIGGESASIDRHGHPGLFSVSRCSIDEQATRMTRGQLSLLATAA